MSSPLFLGSSRIPLLVTPLATRSQQHRQGTDNLRSASHRYGRNGRNRQRANTQHRCKGHNRTQQATGRQHLLLDAGRICATWRCTLVGTWVVGRKWIGITLFWLGARFMMGVGVGIVDAFPSLDRWRLIGICLSGARSAAGTARADVVG